MHHQPNRLIVLVGHLTLHFFSGEAFFGKGHKSHNECRIKPKPTDKMEFLLSYLCVTKTLTQLQLCAIFVSWSSAKSAFATLAHLFALKPVMVSTTTFLTVDAFIFSLQAKESLTSGLIGESFYKFDQIDVAVFVSKMIKYRCLYHKNHRFILS